MEGLENTSVIGRLLEEISWEGRRVKEYRRGGRGRENVLTAEVLYPLSFLPRAAFLGEVLRNAHGAEDARAHIAAEAEEVKITMLPDETHLGSAGTIVQPDAALDAPSTFGLVEAKRIRGSRFQKQQLAREFLAAWQEAGERRLLLLLIMGDAPPITVKGHPEKVDPEDAIRSGLDDNLVAELGLTHEHVMATVPESLAWMTWTEIQEIVARQSKAFESAPEGLAGTVRRLSRAVDTAINWHGW